MNILWISSGLPFPSNSGGKVVISNRMIHVAKYHKIYMITEGTDVNEDTKRKIGDICKDYTIIKSINRTRTYLFKWLLTHSLNVERYRNQELTNAILDYVKKYKIDLINIDLPMTFVNLFPILNEIKDIPVVINMYNIEFSCVKSKTRISGINLAMKLYAYIESKRLYRWEKRVYETEVIRAFSFVSENDIKLFSSSFDVRSRELFHASIGTNLPTKCGEKMICDGKAIVFPAAFDYHPNIHGAVWFVKHVLPLIKKKVPEVKLFLVGRNPKKEVKNLQNDNVIITGTVQSIFPYMDMASIFIVPIFFGGGVKTKLIEMGCWKKPVVSSSFGCIGTLYKDGEDILVKDEPHEFANACIDALNNIENYSLMIENMARKTEENYMWERIGREYCEFLERQVYS